MELLTDKDIFESRFSKICKELKWDPPSFVAKADEKKRQTDFELLEQYSPEIKLNSKVKILETMKHSTDFAYSKVRKKKITLARIPHLTIVRLKEELRILNIVPPIKATKVSELVEF